MAHYKHIKYPAFLAASLCLSLNAFGSAAVSTHQPPLEEEKGTASVPLKRTRSAYESSPSSLSSASAPSSLPTLADVQERLMSKVSILKTELPKAQSALATIEEVLTAKARSLVSSDLRRATELAGLVSTMKVLNGSLRNTVFLASKDRTDDNAWITVAMAVMASGALAKQLNQFTIVLGAKEDTQDIDCSILTNVSAQLHEITKDIVDPLQVS